MSFNFGSTTASSAPTFGFGSNPTPTFGSSSTPSFGATTSTPSFGATGVFGSTPNFGSTPSFGSATSTPFSFSGSNFGAKTTASSGFGTASIFGGGGPSYFGTTQPTQAASAPAFSGLGTQSSFGQPVQAQAAQPTSTVDAQYNAVLFCNIYGDERDAILSKWNALQACWGTGKGYYTNTAVPVEFKPDGHFCRFKSVLYIPIPETKDEEGLVALIIQKKASDVSQNQASLVSVIQQALGNRPGLLVSVISVSPVGETKCEVLITVEEKTAVGGAQKAGATTLANYLWGQQNIKANLESQGVANCYPRNKPSASQIKEYLDVPPAGIDVRLWRQAVNSNPDKDRYLPVPVISFEALAGHSKSLQAETERQGKKLDEFASELAKMQRGIAEASATINQMKMTELSLQHRLLKVIIKQEYVRRAGIGLTSEEEKLGARLESLVRELSLPAQFRGKLNELLSQLRLRTRVEQPMSDQKASLDPNTVAELKTILIEEQKGLKELLDIINEDFAILKSIESAAGTRV
ncbi:nuclear pore complex protein Nup54-like [Artemia franciscana]|uniref:nuclear pore complex protein Nup54-like n=1 Tax=Artemia franciscana TaxID=6661 RepID=UPI0032DAE52B